MKIAVSFIGLLFVGFIATNPVPEDDDRLVIDKEFYPLEFVKYKGDHDIVNLLVPLNSLNFDENESIESDSEEPVIFFVEADVTDDGKRIDQGLYILKDNKATKILDHGRDAAASGDDSKSVFFGAKDGIYIYKDGKTEKYGSLTDNIIQIAKEKSGDVLYILTEDRELYKVFDDGNKKKKLDVGNPEEFVIDYNNNVYFYSKDKEVKVYTNGEIRQIKGLPTYSNIKLVKPPFVLEDGVPLVVDKSLYIIYSNGTIEEGGIDFKPKYLPTAYAPEAAIIQYYAYDKKIYEYNILLLLLGSLLEDLKEYLEKKEDTIRSLPAQRKSMKQY